MKEKHLQAFMRTAKVFSECSTATRLKVGCIAVKENKIISIGYNGTPPGFDNCCEDENGKTKPEVIHAEANMLMKLAKDGGGAKDSVVFCTHSPCIECAKMIYASGVKEVYYEELYRSDAGIEFLHRAGVQTIKLFANTK